MTSETDNKVEAAVELIAAPCTLQECPPGPFRFNGSLGFKTEYHLSYPSDLGGGKFEYISTPWPDAYCMDSGEVFWGGAKTHEERGALIVQPIELAIASLDRTACEIPDFLKRQTGELPPAPMPAWRDDGREGRREGAEEDPEPAQEVAGLEPGDLESTLRMCEAGRGHNPGMISIPVEKFRAVLTAALSSSPSQGGETKWVCVHCGHADGQPHDPSCPLAKPIPDVSGLVEALEKPPCAAGCEGLCEQKYVAEPDVHACCVVRRLHRAYAAFQSRKEEKQP